MEGVPEYRDYLQTSTYVEINPEVWRMAVDLQESVRMFSDSLSGNGIHLPKF